MRLALWSFLFLVILVTALGKHHRKHQRMRSGGYVRGCYYTNWSQGRNVLPFYPEHITKGLCTHILYAFGKFDTNGNIQNYESNDPDLQQRISALKNSDPNLKILISYGGYNFGREPFEKIATSTSASKQFAESVLGLIKKYNFDGVDIDWEYPTFNADLHIALSKVIREVFDSKQPGLLLTAAVSAGEGTIRDSYDIKSMASLYDLLFLMSYDLHGSWETAVNMHAKLHDSGSITKLTTEIGAKAWVNGGFPKSKLVIGIPTYSRGWTLASASQNIAGSSATGASNPTSILDEAGSAAYFEICEMKSSGGSEMVDGVAIGAYLVKGNQWHGYDNPQTVAMKMEWVKSEGYAGAFIWALDTDDFTGKYCGEGKYPIMNAINKGLGGSVPAPEPDATPSPNPDGPDEPDTDEPNPTPGTTTTAAAEPDDGASCPDPDGHYRHPSDCTKFIQCGWSIPREMSCPEGLFFNEDESVCDHMFNAPPGRC